MAATDLIDGQVSAKITSVNSVITTALAQSQTFMDTLQNIESLRPPFFTPGALTYTPDPIAIDVTLPEGPDMADIMAIQPSGVEDFVPGTITQPADYISAELLGMLPVIPDAPTEADYSSDLLTALKDELLNDVAGGVTGISATVEQAMWDRHSERDAQVFADAMDRLKSAWAASGAVLPDATLIALAREKVTEAANQQLDNSRKITEESFKMAVENRKFSITQGIVLESALMQHFNNVADRAIRY